MRDGAAEAGMGLGHGGREEGERRPGGKRLGALVGWLGREVGGLQETVLSRERGATVISEIFLGGTSWGRSPLALPGYLPVSVSANACGLGLPPMGVPLGLKPNL